MILTGVIKNGQNSEHSGSTVLNEKYMFFLKAQLICET